MQESQMRPSAIGKPNRDGSYDIGLMQINSTWLPKLSQWGITEASLLDGCVNAYVGTWILAGNIKRLGYTWNAVGAFNALSPSKRAVYVANVYRQYLKIQPDAQALAGIPMTQQ
jgi:soluble lytic murein transglycosylase-like protein